MKQFPTESKGLIEEARDKIISCHGQNIITHQVMAVLLAELQELHAIEKTECADKFFETGVKSGWTQGFYQGILVAVATALIIGAIAAFTVL